MEIKSKIVDPYVENYIRDLLSDREDYFKELEAYAHEHNVPIVHPEIANFLEVFLKINKPKRVLEVGTAIGYSASIFAKNMDEGEVVTVELNPEMVKLATANISKLDTNTQITIIEGDAKEVLPQIEGKFDLIFIDAAKGHYQKFFDDTLSKLNSGGIIISDNVLYKGMIATNEYLIRRKITIVKRMRKYLSYISDHELLDTTILPMGDGLAISYYNKK